MIVMEPATLLWVLAVGLMLVGLAGTVLPILPGVPVMLLGMFIAAWIDGFARIGPWTLALLAALTVVTVVVDLVASGFGARRVGASRQAVLGATLGAVAGFFLGLVGLIVGPFIGAVAGELLARRQLTRKGTQAAVNVGFGAWMGFVLGTVAKLAVAFTMLGVFVAAWYFE